MANPPKAKPVLDTVAKDNTLPEGTVVPLTDKGPGPSTMSHEEAAATSLMDRTVIICTKSLVWRSLERRYIGGNKHKDVAAGPPHVIAKDTLFESMDKLKATGLDARSIEQAFKSKHLVYRALGNMGSVGGLVTPPVLGNTTGNPTQDLAMRLHGQSGDVAQNTAGVKWGWNPANLQRYQLPELQTIIADTDVSITPPDTVSGCVSLLSSQFLG